MDLRLLQERLAKVRATAALSVLSPCTPCCGHPAYMLAIWRTFSRSRQPSLLEQLAMDAHTLQALADAAEARSAARLMEVKLQRQDRALVAALATAAERAGQLQALEEVLRDEQLPGEGCLCCLRAWTKQ